jgi:hypothetical protein
MHTVRTRFEHAVKLSALAVLLGGLAACASAADPNAMALTAPAATDKPFPVPLQHAMCVRTVTGGEDTNPLWVSKVGDAGFKTALTSSLTSANLEAAADTDCHYPIDVNLLGLSQPALGFDMTVTSHVNYKVYDPAGQPFLLETLDTPYTAKFGDALVGVQRLKLANEGSIRESITKFFDKLRDTTPK